MTPEVSVDESDGALLVGVDGDNCSGALSLDREADPEDVEETLRTLLQEAKHSARVRGGGR